ncbi:hypothetical protein RA210_U10371 [Rubrivivax sp. A210]|nr:hypothetical protein RA210_U10371 [Rubrivivax sp. A210]
MGISLLLPDFNVQAGVARLTTGVNRTLHQTPTWLQGTSFHVELAKIRLHLQDDSPRDTVRCQSIFGGPSKCQRVSHRLNASNCQPPAICA